MPVGADLLAKFRKDKDKQNDQDGGAAAANEVNASCQLFVPLYLHGLHVFFLLNLCSFALFFFGT